MRKRVLSFILAIAMIATMLPTMPIVAAEAGGYTFVYNFNPNQITSNDISVAHMDAYGSSYEGTHQMWQYHSAHAKLAETSIRGYVCGKHYVCQIQSGAVGRWAAFELNVPVAGEYTVTHWHGLYKVGSYANIYMLPPGTTDIDAAIADDTYKINSEYVDYYQNATGATGGYNVVFDKKLTVTEQTKGKWICVILCAEKNANVNMYPGSIELSSGTGALPMELSASLDEVISVGSSVNIAFSGYMSNGAELSVSKIGSLSCTSKNPEVATVDNSGKVTGVSVGEAVIEIQATTAGVTLTDEVTVTVDSTMIPNGNTFIYDLNPDLTKDVLLSSMTIEDTRGMWLWGDATRSLLKTDTHTTSGVEAGNSTNGEWFAVKINVPVAGKYQAELTHARSRSSGGYGKVYVLSGDADIASVIENADPLGGEVSYYNPDKGESGVVTALGTINLETAGEYYLVFRSARNGDGYQNHPNYENGAGANNRMYPYMLTLKNGDNSVPMLVKADFDMSSIRINETGKVSLKTYMSDKTVISESSNNVNITYESKNPDIATVDANGVVTGIAAGEAEIEVSVTSNGVTKSGSAIVNVSSEVFKLSDYTLMYDFTYDMKKITNVNWADITETHTRNFWMPHSLMPGLTLTTLRKTSYGLQIGTSNNQFVVLTLNVPASGVYRTNVGVLQGVSGGQMALYIVDGDTSDIASALPEAQKIGTFNCYASATTDNIYFDGANIEFSKAGKYLLVVKSEGLGDGAGNGKSANMYLKSVKFIGLSEETAIESIFLSKYETELGVDETDSIEITDAYLSDCTVASASDYTLLYKSSNESVATVDTNGNIKAVSSGNAVITVTATRGESTAIREVKVAVLPDTYSGFTAKYNLTANDEFAGTTFANTHNLWSFNSSNTNVSVNKNSIQFGTDASSEASVKINVPVDGEYQVKVSHAQAENGAVGAVYVDGEKIGTIDYSAQAAETNFAAKYFSKGEHVVSFKYESGEGVLQTPANITLYGGKKLAISDAELVFAYNAATVMKVWLSDGNEGNVADTVVRYGLKSDSNAAIDIESGKVDAAEVDAAATISAEVSVNNTYITKYLDVTVIGVKESAYSLVYDFREVDIADGMPLKGVEYSQTNGFWKYHSAKVESTGIKTANYGFYLTLAKGNWAAVKIYVPAPGRYSARLDHLAGTTGGIGEVHILPGDTEDIDAAISSGMSQNLGEANFYTPGTSTYPQTTLQDVTFFEAGEYIIVFRSIQAGGNGSANMYPQQIVFNAEKENPTLQSATLSDYELCKDESVLVKVKDVYLTDYTTAELGSYSVSVKTDDVAIASVQGNMLTGVSSGTTKVNITLTKGDVDLNVSSKVVVLPEGSSGYTFVYDFTRTTAEDYKTSDYGDTYNFWKIKEVNTDNITIGNGYITFGSDSDDYIVYEINVPVAGKYRASLVYGNNAQGAQGSVYIGKSVSDAIKIGTIHYTGGVTAVLDDVEFAANGKYLVIFKYESGEGKLQLPGQLKLVGGSKSMLVGVELEADEYGATVVGGVLSDGNSADLTGARIEYSLGNLEAGVINKDTGKIIPSTKGGKAKVFANVLLGDTVASGEADVTITANEYSISGEMAQYRFYEHSADWESPYVTNYRNYDIRKITREFTDGNWAWWGASPKLNVDGRGSLVYAYTSAESTPRLRIVTYTDEWIAFEIDVPKAGTYWATLDSAKSNRSNAGAADIYILPLEDGATAESVEAALDKSTLAGHVSFMETSLAANKWNGTIIDNLSLINVDKAGKYLFVVEQTDGEVAKELTLKSLTLDGSENMLQLVDLSLEKTVYEVGEKAGSTYVARMLDGTELAKDVAGVVYESSDESVATFENGVVTAVGKGITELSVAVVYNGVSVKASRMVLVNDNSGIAGIKLQTDSWGYTEERIKLSTKKVYNSGGVSEMGDIPVVYTVVEGDGVIANDEYLIANSAGVVKVSASAKVDGVVLVSQPIEILIKDRTQKTEPTYYTYERRQAARDNMKKYDWASTGYNQTITYAEKYFSTYEYLYEHMTGEGLPRSQRVGEELDPEYKKCRYCGVDTVTLYGSGATGGYSVNVYARPWKIQCKECKRYFPSNDFGLLYKRGIDEYGIYSRERAIEKNAEAVANGEKDALKNDLYPELYTEGNALYNKDPRGEEITWGENGADLGMVTDPSTGEQIIGGKMWGVDDGEGYLPGRKYSNGSEERHGYIAYYVHKLWDEVNYSVRWLSMGYVYSGDEKYGRAGTIVLDRLSDLYPTFAQKQWDNMYLVSHGGSGFGKIFGCINDCEYVTSWAQYADALYPIIMQSDPQVIKFLTEKSQQYGFKSLTNNPKTSGEKIWSNVEDGLLREIVDSVKDGNICGNYGQAQKALAAVALVLDNEPESNDIVEFLYRPGARVISGNTAVCEGGNLSVQFIDVIDRDGMGNEAAPNYNLGWIADLYECADMLNMYTDDPKFDLYQNPKYAKMFTAAIPVVLTDDHTAQIGDTSWTASIAISGDQDLMIKGFKELKDTSLGNELAEFIYRRNGYTEKGLHYDYFTTDPERLQKDILDRIDNDLTQKSEMMPAYGFSVLREGDKYGDDGMPTYINNMRDFWLYFGRNAGHGHWDTLNLGIEAFGLNMAPDNGTPEVKSSDPNRAQWVEPTIAHNTVTVNEKNQKDVGLHGFPKHFDDSGDVKVMDIDASNAYAETSIYRRTVVMINAGPDVSYGVDFFRVKGGDDHIYSFHSQSEKIFETEGLENVEYQTDDGTATGNYVGTYAGRDVAFGPDPCGTYVESQFVYPHGYTWMKNIRKAGDVGKFAVDFDVTDYRKALKDGNGLHLRMTMLNDFELSEVALTSGYVIRTSGTAPLPETFEYVLARRKGTNLDSLFTTVYEPYRNERYISDMEAVENISIVDGTEKKNDEIKVVKVTRTDNRVDYVIYATNNNVLYNIVDGEINFNFRGFIGVYSINAEGMNIYNYIHDGDIIGDIDNVKKAYKGVVEDLTRELSFENNIVFQTKDDVDIEEITGKYVFIENDAKQNAVYKIEGAEKIEGGVKLNIGATTLIRSLRDATDNTKGYTFNIAKGQVAYIPLSNVDDNGPVFSEMTDKIATANSVFKTSVSAVASDNASLKYIATVMPRGAILDEELGAITWKPDSSQIGDSHFAITARDEYGRESTLHFIVSVYGTTTGTVGTGNSAGAGVGGSSSGSGTTKPQTPTTPTEPETLEDEEKTFIDLGSHAWAEDAINALAKEGIIKGTSSTTFSPAANITRADFAILLVRAFELTSDNTENFADVTDSDYFAKELAIARNNGIINGVGDNKYAPRNTITRQDMMTIVYRAMVKLGIKLKETTDTEMPDTDAVANYAKEAVNALIGAGLVNGKSGKIAPFDYTTRAEVAVLLKRILDYMK